MPPTLINPSTCAFLILRSLTPLTLIIQRRLIAWWIVCMQNRLAVKTCFLSSCWFLLLTNWSLLHSWLLFVVEEFDHSFIDLLIPTKGSTSVVIINSLTGFATDWQSSSFLKYRTLADAPYTMFGNGGGGGRDFVSFSIDADASISLTMISWLLMGSFPLILSNSN